ncbi:hypothetical protein RBE51_22350 [Pseudomonas taiwanensis]|uniref:hypothetical protein n=1 Tax=Pseudomonas taiwanensis TaxID=470150 RepID=UPI0028DD482A|nr:hypothetical protein [Pseudomonas taiwanensis]MDT8925527.1 hypothetical protein [Pseudomonas taiwanensis]
MFVTCLGKRSPVQVRKDKLFMEALSKIKTLEASNGFVSMQASGLQEQVEKLHEIGKRLVNQLHASAELRHS